MFCIFRENWKIGKLGNLCFSDRWFLAQGPLLLLTDLEYVRIRVRTYIRSYANLGIRIYIYIYLLFPCLFNLVHCRRTLKAHRNGGKHVLFVQTAVLQNGRTLGYTSASSRVASWRFFQGTVPALALRTWSPQSMLRSTGARGYVNEWAVQSMQI